ncbi:hypothetical protein KIN20_004346 [Parelaphostrongylus tenuis]|uniref:Uncharacterized protein n=1 Tax=Parelaphostrongylus tenuis TaxID=148309 RepID=A0AAD5M1K4_PARTN|nr:hypothetical protein KIN20_004346 [Parelaphostrongylus tenuis]
MSVVVRTYLCGCSGATRPDIDEMRIRLSPESCPSMSMDLLRQDGLLNVKRLGRAELSLLAAVSLLRVEKGNAVANYFNN